MKGERFSLLPMPSMMGFTLALAHISLMVPNCIQIHADVRLVGDFALSQQTSSCAQEHMEQSRLVMLRCHWLNFLQSSFWSKGLLDPSISTPTGSVCSGKVKIAQRTERGAHVTLWSRLQQALSRHQGAAKPTSLRTISISSI